MERIAGDQSAGQPQIAVFHLVGCPLVLVGVEVDPLALAHQGPKGGWQVGEPADPLNPGHFPGLFLGELRPLPGLQVLARLAEKEHLPVRRIGCIRAEHEHALFLLDTREPEQVAGRMHLEGAVPTARNHVGGVQDGERFRGQELREPPPVGGEEIRIEGRVTHGGLSEEGKGEPGILRGFARDRKRQPAIAPSRGDRPGRGRLSGTACSR